MNLVNRRMIIILISIILIFIIAGITAGSRGNLTWPERLVKDTVSFFQQIVSKPVNAVAGFFADVSKIFSLYEENRQLKSALQQLAQLEATNQLLTKENERLREMLDVKSNLTDYKMYVAEVVARQHDSWYNIITINRGERDGLQPNMAVTSASGLIGFVDSVSYFSSNVRLLTDIERGNHISAIVLDQEEAFGIVESYDVERRELIMRKIPLETPIEVGNKVVSSGLGGIVPKGILIGEITEVIESPDQLTQMAYIRPAADLYHIHEVFILSRNDVEQNVEEETP